jgi:hypothetical protein
MSPTDDELVAAIEETLLFYPPVPGLSEDLGIAGVRGRVTPLSHPLANLVGLARLGADDADATISRVKERFASERKAFGWVTGPSTTPADLAERLEAAGIHHEEALAGMALTDLATPMRSNETVRVREVTPDEASRESAMMARAYGMPEDVATLFVRLLAAGGPIRSRGYLAYLDDERPVAWSYLVYVPESEVVLLGGAATVAEARGHGIYTTLVKRRLDDARADGRTAAIIQAVRGTSAPICARLGFRELCSLDVFGWAPAA